MLFLIFIYFINGRLEHTKDIDAKRSVINGLDLDTKVKQDQLNNIQFVLNLSNINYSNVIFNIYLLY